MLALPETYSRMSLDELADHITQRKQQLGDSLCILGHHYQRDEVIRFADLTGDSLKLSRQAAEQSARYIVFCGVHFMAESADILSGDSQIVCLPNFQAGCAMADMATDDAVGEAMDELAAMAPQRRALPITYVNSSAAIKAITGRSGGACCTSSNVRNVFEWALRPVERQGGGADLIVAIPDRHLARNTAVAMGYDESACVVYDPTQPNGGLNGDQLADATFVLWAGHCYVHQLFKPEHITVVRQACPDIRVIVHPECPREVVAAADLAGSTEQIIRTIADAPPGSQWAVGTEENLVRRLAHQHPDKTVRLLSETPARCVQMAQIDLPHLAWCLDSLDGAPPPHQVTVPPDIAADARKALQRMIDIRGTDTPTSAP
jgi:quinolinate synthase